MLKWIRRCLEEKDGKTSIKRIMLMAWFVILGVSVFVGSISWEMITIFAMLLGNKTIESLKELNR